MLTDFNDILMYLTLFATNWYIPFVIWCNICRDIMISETVKFFKQLRYVMQGRTMQNKRAKFLNNSVICSVSLKAQPSSLNTLISFFHRNL